MWEMLHSWLTITLAQQSGDACRGSAAGFKQGSQPFFPANAPVKTEIIPYIIGLNYTPSHLTAASLAPEVRSNIEQ